MPVEISQLVRQIHASGKQLVLAVNGGSAAIPWLLTVPGASRCVLLAVVPYAAEAMMQWLGSKPEQFCSSRTARAMAMAAYQNARRLTGSGIGDGDDSPVSTSRTVASRLLGVGCTVSLASDRPKRGPHRFFVATQSEDTTTCLFVELEKGRRSRSDEEHIVGLSILNEIALACQLNDRLAIDLTSSERERRSVKTAPDDWQDLLAGKTTRICNGPPTEPRVLFPGAFNPLHSGHRRMAEIASRILQSPVTFEISIANVDKPPLDYLEIEQRLAQFANDQSVWLTQAPTFVQKAALFPGVTFIVGVDTLHRIALPPYYHDNVPAMLRAIDELAIAGCRFLVFGRTIDGQFHSLEDLNIPPSLAALCQTVPSSEFRDDISSTELRQKERISND
jgi:hypothetical protein